MLQYIYQVILMLSVYLCFQCNHCKIVLYKGNESILLNITVPAKQTSATSGISISSAKELFTITNLCLNDTKATGPDNVNNTCSNTNGVTGPDGPNATNVTVTIGGVNQTTVGKLST